MDHKYTDNNIIITRLTALWALNESGLGGMMFAMHIPLTGFFVGGFAVILISLIAFYSNNNFKQVLKATLLVLIIKATASPHAPPPAYIAVAFQGAMGAIIFSVIRNYKVATVLLAVLAMAESALQKVIVMTLIYGKSLWEAVDKFLDGIGKDFSISPNIAYSYWIILIYVSIHVFWGVLLGLFAGRLPGLINKHTNAILEFYHARDTNEEEMMLTAQSAKRKNRFWIRFLFTLLFVVAVFFFSGSYAEYKVLYAIFRSIAAVLLLFFVLRPLLTWAIQLWLKRQSSATKLEAVNLMAMMPGFKSYVKPSWQMAKSNPENMGRLRYFILSMIILSLYDK